MSYLKFQKNGFMGATIFFLVACLSTTGLVASERHHPERHHKKSVLEITYPRAQAEVLEAFTAIATSIITGAGTGYNSEYMDQLISYHGYGDKFVEFNGGEVFDSAGNEHNERQLFGEDINSVIRFAPVDGTLKVAVYYRNVANLTFISDFILDHKEYGEITVNNLITLLFVKTKGKWKLVHEHHSPAM